MRTPEEQFKGLRKLARVISQKECNVGIRPAGSDVAYLQALDTPRASQIVYASGGYDVWAWTPNGYVVQATDLSRKAAAKVVIAEYFLAKAARIKSARPNVNVDDVMRRLYCGYQNLPPVIVVTKP